MKLPAGFLLPEGATMADVRRLDFELLASEGLEVQCMPMADGEDDQPTEQ